MQKPTRPKPLNAIQIIEGAAALMRMARNIDIAAQGSRDGIVRLRKTEIAGLSTMLRHSAVMIDRLVGALEHGDKLEGGPPIARFSKNPEVSFQRGTAGWGWAPGSPDRFFKKSGSLFSRRVTLAGDASGSPTLLFQIHSLTPGEPAKNG